MTILVDEVLEAMPAEECEKLYKVLRYRWNWWGRRKQLPPEGEWDIWGLVAGRGSGKTRPASEWVIGKAQKMPGARWALVGRTASDVRDVMVLGESGILASSPPWFRPRYYPSRRVVVWPNGFQAHLYSADEPDLLRGPQHHGAWGDEFPTWPRPEAWTNLQDGLRLGDHPQCLLTGTPRRSPLFLDTFLGPKDRIKHPKSPHRPVTPEMIQSGAWEFTFETKDQWGNVVKHRTVVRRWSTEENSLNLAPGFAAKRRALYGDSAFGRMELDAEPQEIVEGALFDLAIIDDHRVPSSPAHYRRVVGVDPSHSADGRYDACGIIVVGAANVAEAPGKPELPHGYVLDDCTLNASPNAWGHQAVKAHDDYRCDAIVYERNASPDKPDVVPDVIRTVDPHGRIRWIGVYSDRDKRTRADPIASLYEAGRVHHVKDPDRPNHLAQLEDEMTSWDPWDPKAKSPNRVDALVHGLRHLLLGDEAPPAPPSSTGQRSSGWRGVA